MLLLAGPFSASQPLGAHLAVFNLPTEHAENSQAAASAGEGAGARVGAVAAGGRDIKVIIITITHLSRVLCLFHGHTKSKFYSYTPPPPT